MKIIKALEVTVDFASEIISCIKDKDDKIISGDPKKVKKNFMIHGYFQKKFLQIIQIGF